MPQYEVKVTDRIPNSIQQKIDGIARSARQANISIAQLRKNLNFRGGGFDRVGQSASSASTSVSNASRSVQNYQRRITSASRANTVFATTTAATTRTLRNLLVIAGGIRLGSGIAASADQFRTVDNRISQVSTSIQNQEALYQRIFALAQETRVPVEQLASTFQRFQRVLGLLGKSQQETLRFTEILTKALIANGSTAQETESAIIQLSQGFNALALQGEELRAVRENVPIEVLRSLSAATGESVDKLKELGRQGRLTPSVIVKGFEQAADGVFKSFDKIIPKLSERFIQLRNGVTDFLRDFEKRTGFFEALGEQIFKLANNLDTFLNRLAGVAIAFSVFQLLTRGSEIARGSFKLLTGQVFTLRSALISTGVGAVAVFIGTLVAFRNEISLSEDGVVTLADVMKDQWGKLKVFFDQTSKDINKSINESFEPDENIGVGYRETFLGILGEGVKVFTTLPTVLIGGFEGAFTVISALAKGIFAALAKTVAQAFVTVIKFIEGAIQEATNSSISGLNKIIEGLNRFRSKPIKLIEPIDLGGSNLTKLNQFIREQDKIIRKNRAITDNPLLTIGQSVEDFLDAQDLIVDGLTDRVRQGLIIVAEGARDEANARIAEAKRADDELKKGQADLNKKPEQTLFESNKNQLTNLQKINQGLQFQSRFILDSVNANKDLSNSFTNVGNSASESFDSVQGGLESLSTQGEDVSKSLAGGFNEAFEGFGSLLEGDVEEGLPKLLKGVSKVFQTIQQQRQQQEQIRAQAQRLQQRQNPNQQSGFGAGFNRALAGNTLRQGDPGGVNAFNQKSRFGANQFALRGALQKAGFRAAPGFGQAAQGGQGSQSVVSQVGQDAQQAKQQIDQATESVNRFKQQSGINSQQGQTGQQQDQQGSSLFGGGGEQQSQQLQQTQQALQQLLSISTQVQSALEGISSTDFSQLSTSISTASQSFNQLPQVAQAAASGVQSSMGAIVSSLNQVTEAANQAAAAIERLNSAGRGGGGGGGGGGGLGRGFMTGGFTGNVSRRRVAGHVHGREFVVNAGATRGNRAALEQLNKTGSLPSTRSGGNVTINNNAGVAVSTSTNRDGDLMIEVDRRIERSNQNLDGRLAALTGNPNSRFSKSLRNNTKGGSRRRSG